MKLGAIDVGTNSCRMLVMEYSGGRYTELARSQEITRLGAGVDQNRFLGRQAVERTVAVIKSFTRMMAQYQPTEINIVGTSALRDVKNPQLLSNRLEEETGKRIKVISGAEEAGLIYQGVNLNLAEGDYLIIDIGGGSTELIWSDTAGINYKSLDMGALRMTERYLENPQLPLTQQELAVMQKGIRAELGVVPEVNGETMALVGTGGTVTTLAAIDLQMEAYDSKRIDRYCLTRARIAEILSCLSRLSARERSGIPGLQKGREEIIIAGTVILAEIMTTFGFKEMTISEQGILLGLIRELVNSL
ncbi:MAG: Ppx/GppA family phosphatase [Halanaerobiales bacterium]|nr:Ppx/GppA family phosphatase [Halanaerobiales bacterium]